LREWAGILVFDLQYSMRCAALVETCFSSLGRMVAFQVKQPWLGCCLQGSVLIESDPCGLDYQSCKNALLVTDLRWRRPFRLPNERQIANALSDIGKAVSEPPAESGVIGNFISHSAINGQRGIRQATHSICVASVAIFLWPFSAQKSLVKSKIPQFQQNKAYINEI
jgi:hypothetical protein